MGTEVIAKNLTKKRLGTIKHGVELKAKYIFTKRVGYGTFEDTLLAEDSDIETTHKFYCDLGLYYNFTGDYNIQLDTKGAYHIYVDRNNAEHIGNLTAGQGDMAGYYNTEFLHDR